MERLGKYEIRGVLGKGAMGTVYDAHDPVIDRRVAIKTLTLPDASDAEAQDELQRFKREAQAAGRLTHRNIVGVFDYGETDTLAYIVMEFVDGRSLKDALDKHERFPVAETVRIMEGLLEGLQFSHERGVVHRDIKPANVMLTQDGRVKIADFGIARIESSSMTQAGTIMGTPAYMSPEQFMGQTVDPRTDIYSAGVLLYQMLTGERPFEGSMTAIMHKALNVTPPRPSELSVTTPSSMDEVVATAMAKRPEQRFASASAFGAALKAALAAADAPAAPARPTPAADTDATVIAAHPTPAQAARPAPPAAPPARPAGRSKAPLFGGIAAVILVAAAGGTYLALSIGPGPVPPPAPAPVPMPVGPSTVAPPAPVPVPAPTPVPPPAPTIPAAPVPAPAPIPAPAPQPAPRPTPPPQPAPAPQPVPVPRPVPQPIPAPQPVPAPQPLPQPAPAPRPVPVPQPVPQPVPAPQPAPVPQPAPTPAPPSAASLRAAIGAAVAPFQCALIGGDVSEQRQVTVSGFVSRDVEPRLRAAVRQAAGDAPVQWDVRTFSGPYCRALDVIRPIGPHFGEPAGNVAVGLKSGAAPLSDTSSIVPRVTTPGYTSYLQVDYFAGDGSMVHLHPSVEERQIDLQAPDRPAQHLRTTMATAERSFPAHTTLTLGDPVTCKCKPTEVGWTVGPPFGTDMIIAIASSAPLFVPARTNSDTVDTYLRALQTAIAEAARKGVKLSANVVGVVTVPR